MQSSSTRRVVVTGAGLVGPFGNSIEAAWESLDNQRSAVRTLVNLQTNHLPTPYGAEAWDFTGHIDDFGPLDRTRKRAIKKALKLMCRETQMAVAAAQWALLDAKLEAENFDPDRTGVIFGADHMLTTPNEYVRGISCCLDDHDEFQFERWGEEGLPKVEPLWLLKYLPNMPACCIAIYNDLRGPNNSITIREASANLAMGEAFHIILRGDADTLITGATGTRVHPLRTALAATVWELAKNDDNDPTTLSRPFDSARTGMVLGEGAGALVVDLLETAQSRKAPILGEIVGCGASAVMDRDLVPQPGQALENAMRQALTEAGMTPDEVGHVHAHGLGTRQGDADEAKAIDAIFGQRSTPIPVIAAKSYFGNLGAGAGTHEIIASLLAIKHGRLFPILNYTTPDPECPIAAVTNNNTPPGNSFLNLNYTPQGQASAILIRAFEG